MLNSRGAPGGKLKMTLVSQCMFQPPSPPPHGPSTEARIPRRGVFMSRMGANSGGTAEPS